MLYNIKKMLRGEYQGDSIEKGALLCKDFSMDGGLLTYSNLAGVYADTLLALSGQVLDNKFLNMVGKIVKTIDVLIKTKYEGDYIGYVGSVQDKVGRVSREFVDIKALHLKYKDMWVVYDDGTDLGDYYWGFSPDEGKDAIMCLQEAVCGSKVSIASRVERLGSYEYWLSDRFDIDIEYANAVNSLLDLLVYMHNSASYREGKYFVFDEIEIQQRYDYAMFLASTPYRRLKYEEGQKMMDAVSGKEGRVVTGKHIKNWSNCDSEKSSVNGKNILNYEQFYAALYMEMVLSEEWMSRGISDPVVPLDKLLTKFTYEFCYENQNDVWVLRSYLKPAIEGMAERLKGTNGFVNTSDFLGVLKSNVILYNPEHNLKDLGFGGIFSYIVRKYGGVYQNCDKSDSVFIRELNCRGIQDTGM